MSFTATGAWLSAKTTSLTVSNQAAGNLLVVAVINYSSSSVYCSSLTGGGANWTRVATGTNTHTAGTVAIFFGTVTLTGAGTAVPSWSGTTPTKWGISGREFIATQGWVLDTSGLLNSATDVLPMPSLTPGAGAGELYFGYYTSLSASVTAGSTAGYTYSTIDSYNEGALYNPSCTSAAQAPSYGTFGMCFGMSILVKPAPPTSPFSAVGGWLGSFSSALTVNNQAIGDLLIVEVLSFTNNTVWCTGLSGGGATWVAAGSKVLGVSATATAAVFFGTVISTGAGTVTPSWSGTSPSTYTLVGHEFSSTSGWGLDKQGSFDITGAPHSWPSLTPATGGELYFGFAICAIGASPGSTAGYMYNANADTQSDGAAYNVSCPASATSPDWLDNQEFGVAVLVGPGNATVIAATVTATATVLSPSVSPPQIFHVGDSACYTGTDISPVVAYTGTAGNTLVAVITAYTTGNHPAACNGVFDDVGNTWMIATGGGSYDATTGLYGFTTIACCVSALAMNDITVYFNQNNNYILYGRSSSVQISEFAGLPAGSTPFAVAVSSPDVSTGSYTAPAVTVPDGAFLILSAVASSSTWTTVTPGTGLLNTQGSWDAVTGAGSYAPACTGTTQTVYGAVTVALGFATPTVPALFSPAGGWMGSNSGPLQASYRGTGNLLIIKVINTSNSTVYCAGLTSGKATWVPAGSPFSGSINAMTAAAFFGTVTATGADTITPTWSGATPASWTMAGHEFIATSGWSFNVQAGLDSAGTGTYPALTPSSTVGGLYFGHAATAGAASAGSTPGYVYNENVDGAGSTAAFNVSAPGHP